MQPYWYHDCALQQRLLSSHNGQPGQVQNLNFEIDVCRTTVALLALYCEMEQMMARLLSEMKTEIRTSQAKKEMKEELMAKPEAMLQKQEKM
jgi:hypothetical protein